MIESMISSGGSGDSLTPAEFTVNVGLSAGTAKGTFSFSAQDYGIVDFEIDWGEGGGYETPVTVAGVQSHTYATTSGTFQIKIRGKISIYFNGGGDVSKLVSFDAWGGVKWQSIRSMFHSSLSYCTFPYTDTPDLSECMASRTMFYRNSTFNRNINDWDMTNVTDMWGMFHTCTSFNNGGAGLHFNGTTGNVTDMGSTFYEADGFNVPVVGLDTSSVLDASYLFYGTKLFNQNINSLDLSSCTDVSDMFNLAKAFNNGGVALTFNGTTNLVTDFNSMFSSATVFNQSVNGLDLSSATTVLSMFRSALSFNNGGLALNFTNDTTAITLHAYMFDGAISFNQNVNGLVTGGSTQFHYMFRGANSFNNGGVTLNMDMTSATAVNNMFEDNTLFNQDISGWAMPSVTNCSNFNGGTSALAFLNCPTFMQTNGCAIAD